MPEPDTEGTVGESEVLQAEVDVFVGGQELAKYAIEHGEYLIGRDTSCPIFIDAENVSRHHARLTFTAFELVIEDLGSSNGVFIDGVQVQLPTRIRLDQEVQIGKAQLVIRLRDSTAKQLAAALWDKDLGLEAVRDLVEGRKYKIITTIARGGMGVILQARDVRIRRTVAIKVMNSKHQFSRENALRFVDEAQLTGQLEHPNIVPVYELGVDELGEMFYTMKFVKGTTLDEVLRGIRSGQPKIVEKYPLSALLTIFQKVCDGVAFAHSKGVVHRDLKPENIMIGSFGEVLVMDWGLAKNMTGGRREAPPEPIPGSTATVPRPDNLRGFETMHGLIVGTPPYISPEQARGELDKIDGRSDLYVLGQILYTILTLRAPVEGADIGEIVEKILGSQILHPSTHNQPPKSAWRKKAGAHVEYIALLHCPGHRVPDGLAAVVMKALALDPADRYQTVEDLQEDITACQGGFAPKAERAGLLKHMVLWAGRHKAEVALFAIFFVIFNILIVGFFVRVRRERDIAQANAETARRSQKLADARLRELRGTAPTFADQAQKLMNDQRFGEALEKVEYAIQQVPNEGAFHNLRGDILQAELRLDEAVDAYEDALRLDPQLESAKLNLDLTRHILSEVGSEEQIKPILLAELRAGFLKQGRKSAAASVDAALGPDKQRYVRVWRDTFDRRGVRQPRFETNADGTLRVDFSKVPLPDLSKLRDQPVSALILDDTKVTDLSALKDMRLRVLSLARTSIVDLQPLAGMPLDTINLDGSAVIDIGPLAGLPLESVRLSNTRVRDLSPLRDLKIEQLYMGGCRGVKDLAPLRGLPLQSVSLNGTGVSDLTPLTQSPIRELNLEGCVALTDLRALLAIPTLEGVILPAQCKDVDYLREHPNLKRISYKRMTQTAEAFWAEYDAAHAGEKKAEP
jgi:serine/threonine protein kinase